MRPAGAMPIGAQKNLLTAALRAPKFRFEGRQFSVTEAAQERRAVQCFMVAARLAPQP